MNRIEDSLNKFNIKFKSNLNEKPNQNPSVAIYKEERGITLIALVVTIVVLIILATISINAVLGENGLVRQAEKAGDMQANAEASDSEALSEYDKIVANALAEANGNGGSQTPETPDEPQEPETPTVAVESVSLDKTSEIISPNETLQLTATVTPSDASNKNVTWSSENLSIATVDSNGLVTAVGAGNTTITVTTEDGGKTASCSVTVDKTANWDLAKVNKVTSEDNVVVPVPKGYTASTVDGEKSVATGFVIKEGTDGSATSGINEFVWVPVPEISDLYDEANNSGQLWDFSGTTSTKRTYPTKLNNGCREPDVVTGASSGSDSASGSSYDNGANSSSVKYLDQAGFSTTDANNNLDNSADGLVTASDFKIQLQNEFDEMVESVETYGGFYIGRYETGNLSQTEAVVQKGNTDIGNQTWYTQYKLSKTIGANENVVSSMIWGSQWDATLRWMQTSTVEKVKNFATNSASYGNYYDNSIEYVENGETKTTTSGTGSVIPTGSAEITNINNIYDMTGNVYDWTLEAYYTHSRTERGGSYDLTGSTSPASARNGSIPTNSYSSVGSRATLYVAL